MYQDGANISGTAGADLRAKQFHAVKYDSSGLIVSCGVDGEASIGILRNTPNLGEGCLIFADTGKKCSAIAGAAVATIGTKLKTNTAGRLIAVAAGTDNAIAMSTTVPSGDGGEFEVIWLNQGATA